MADLAACAAVCLVFWLPAYIFWRLVKWAVLRFLRWMYPAVVRPRLPRLPGPADYDEIGDDDSGLTVGETNVAITARTRFRLRALAHLRAEMPYLYRCRGDLEASRRVAEKKLIKWMRDQNVREIDIVRHVPTLVVAAFVPDRNQLDAEEWARRDDVALIRTYAASPPRPRWWEFWKNRGNMGFLSGGGD